MVGRDRALHRPLHAGELDKRLRDNEDSDAPLLREEISRRGRDVRLARMSSNDISFGAKVSWTRYNDP